MVPYIKSSLPIVLFKSGCVFRHRRSYVAWNFIYCDIYRQHSIHVSISGILYSHCILWFPHAIVRHYATLLQSLPPSPSHPKLPSSVYVHLTCHDGLLWPGLVLQNRPTDWHSSGHSKSRGGAGTQTFATVVTKAHITSCLETSPVV